MLASLFKTADLKPNVGFQTEKPQPAPMLAKFFKFDEHKTNFRTEIIAGVTTFVTMAYIIFVNPKILSTTGMDANAVFVATCLAAAIGSAIMGLFANWPIAMAPGMGLNAFFAFTVVGKLGYTWQQALGAVFISRRDLSRIVADRHPTVAHRRHSALHAQRDRGGHRSIPRDHRDEKRRNRRGEPGHLRHARRHDLDGRAAQHLRLRGDRRSRRAQGSRRDPDRRSAGDGCFRRARDQSVWRDRLRAAFDPAHFLQDGSSRRVARRHSARGASDGVGRGVRCDRDADRDRQARRLARRRTRAQERRPQPCAAGGFGRHRRRLVPRHLLDDRLCRERFRRAGGRAHGPDRDRRGGPVSAVDVPRPAGGNRAGAGDRPGAALRRDA